MPIPTGRITPEDISILHRDINRDDLETKLTGALLDGSEVRCPELLL